MPATWEFNNLYADEMAEKRRFLMYISYIGSGFWGSQYQYCRATGVVHTTVQNSIETALKTIFSLEEKRPIIVHLCSRTDSGVHALKAALQVDLPKRNNRFLHPCTIQYKLNCYFKKTCSIRIIDVIHVPDSFSVHKACLNKTYLYRVGVLKKEFCQGRSLKGICLPITEVQRTHFLIGKDFDFEKAQEATHLFVGEKDFAALGRKPNQNVRPTVCNILSFALQNAQPLLPDDHLNEKFVYYQFKCKGTRFLFHMVRSMVGATLSVGMGRTSLDEIRTFFEKPEPSSWTTKIVVVPAHALYLVDTVFDPQQLVMEEEEDNRESNDLEKSMIREKSNSAEAA